MSFGSDSGWISGGDGEARKGALGLALLKTSALRTLEPCFICICMGAERFRETFGSAYLPNFLEYLVIGACMLLSILLDNVSMEKVYLNFRLPQNVGQVIDVLILLLTDFAVLVLIRML